MSNKYYVHGCRIGDGGMERCEDSEAQSWTLYVRDEEGLSQGIIDCVFREDAEAAMAVYVERDALQEQVRALAAENNYLLGGIDWPKEQCPVTGAVTDVQPEDFIPATDAAIREIRAQAVEGFASWQKELAINSQAEVRHAYVGSVKDAQVYAARIRAGRCRWMTFSDSRG